MSFRLDISAKTLDSLLSTGNHLDPAKVEDFLNTPQVITEKIDGVKITMWRNGEPYSPDYKKNWVVAYKNFVLYEEEFDHTIPINFAQFSMLFTVVRNLHNSTPKNTEIFLEFAINKPTLMQKYTSPKIFYIGHASSKGEVVGGYLQTNPEKISYDRPTSFCWSVHAPPVIFKGLPAVTPGESVLEIYENFKQTLLEIPSCIGPRIEGGFGTYQDKPFKIQQPEQVDRAARAALRAEHQYEDPVKEAAYWSKVNALVDVIWNDPALTRLHRSDRPIALQLGFLTDIIVANRFPGTTTYNLAHDYLVHEKKDYHEKINDLYVTARRRLLSERPENKNGLMLGRFQPLTLAHADIMREAAKLHEILWVAVVNGAKTRSHQQLNPLTFAARKMLIETLDIPNVRVIEVPTGSIKAIISSIPSGITHVYCGTDRLDQYQLAVKGMNVNVVEIPRITEVSGTKLREVIRSGDEQTYRTLVDPKLTEMYGYLREAIS